LPFLATALINHVSYVAELYGSAMQQAQNSTSCSFVMVANLIYVGRIFFTRHNARNLILRLRHKVAVHTEQRADAR